MAEHRRYTKRQKAEAVGVAEVGTIAAASRATGIPASNIRGWRADPDFAQLRAEKREDVAQDVWAGFQAGVRRIVALLPLTDDVGKVAVATGILFDKFALMSGEATSRTEHLTLVEGFDDHEREALSAILRRATEAEA